MSVTLNQEVQIHRKFAKCGTLLSITPSLSFVTKTHVLDKWVHF